MKTQLFYIVIISLCAPLTNIYCQNNLQQLGRAQARLWQLEQDRERARAQLDWVEIGLAQLEELEPHRRAPQVQHQAFAQARLWQLEQERARAQLDRVEIELKRVRAQLEELEPHRRAPQVQQQAFAQVQQAARR